MYMAASNRQVLITAKVQQNVFGVAETVPRLLKGMERWGLAGKWKEEKEKRKEKEKTQSPLLPPASAHDWKRRTRGRKGCAEGYWVGVEAFRVEGASCPTSLFSWECWAVPVSPLGFAMRQDGVSLSLSLSLSELGRS
uniref:Uncharacterized protein n=1 Tax=Micrurus surinamensis TaxID=129470 RepID=A0A2D4Q726_MICSU